MSVVPSQYFNLFIDPGHGGGFLGCQVGPRREKEWTLELGLSLQEALSDIPNLHVGFTRSLDLQLGESAQHDIAERGKLSAAARADFCLCIHVNAANKADDKEKVRGMEWYHLRGSALGWAAAFSGSQDTPVLLVKEHHPTGHILVATDDPGPQDDWKHGAYNVINTHESRGVPAVLAECFYGSNVRDVAFAESVAGKGLIVTALRAAVLGAMLARTEGFAL